MYGTTSYSDMLDFYVDLGAIPTTTDLESDYEAIYDGYVLSLFNLNIATALTVQNSHNMVCLLAKESCNCVVCGGLTIDTDDNILVKATFYFADDFL